MDGRENPLGFGRFKLEPSGRQLLDDGDNDECSPLLFCFTRFNIANEACCSRESAKLWRALPTNGKEELENRFHYLLIIPLDYFNYINQLCVGPLPGQHILAK